MYCQKCGVHNADDAKQCQICGIDITGQETQEKIKIFTDLTQHPFEGVLYSLKNVNLLLALIVAPLIAIIYFLKKLSRQPFFSAILNSKTPKYHLTKIEQFQRLRKKSFEKVSSYFAQQGFEPLIDLEDVSVVQGNFNRFLVNQEQKIYGIIHINKATGKVNYVTFFAVTWNKTYLSVANTYGIPLQYPKNLIVQYFPKQSVEKIHQEFLRTLGEIREEPRYLTLKYLLPIGYNVRRFSVEQGLRQGVLSITGKGMPSAVACYHHPSSIAVRTCSVCGTSLCEACYTLYQDKYYCSNCLPKETQIVALQQIPVEGKYAGLGVRAFATFIDLIVLAGAAIGVYFGSRYGVQMLSAEGSYRAVPFVLTQLFGIAFTVFYFIVPLRKYGRTIGGKFLGLRVVDRHGNIPDTVAAIVRFAYHLFACLFVFPLLGYLFIPFRRTKQGLHDQLAGTFVVTKHPRSKTLLSWFVLLILFGAVGWYTYQQIGSWFPSFVSMLFHGGFKTEITLESRWFHQLSDDKTHILSYIMRGDQCIVSTSASIQALNMRTGEIGWTADNLSNVMLQPLSQDTDVPLVVVQYSEEGGASLLNVDPKSGAILWQQALELDEPNVTFDSQSILVHNDDIVSEYDLNGKLLWTSGSLTKRFQDNLVVDYAILNEGILVGRYSEASRTLTYFERRTGKIIWDMKKSEYSPGYTIGDGQQMFYTNDGKTTLMDLPKQKFLWKSPQDIGHVMAYDAKQSYLYTTTSAIHKKDAQNVFSYPENTRFGGITDNFLIVLRESKISPDTYQSEMLLIDKLTGEVKKSFQEKPWFAIVYLSEDQSQIYLAANIKPTNPKTLKISSELLLINKQTLELREILVGENLLSLQFKIFPQENLVFVPTYQSMGGYKYQ